MSSTTDWLELSRPVGEYLNEWADRNDLLAYLGPDRGQETAFCDLQRGLIEANTDFIYKGYTKRDVLKHGVAKFRKFPVATGALYHEAMHARHTPQWYKMDGVDLLSEREGHVLVMMEEPRIEYNGIRHDEKMQRYLRASGLRVAVGKKSKQRSAVDSMPLSLGRVPAGSLTEKDVAHVRELYVDHLGEDVVLAAEDIMRRFVLTADGEHAKMLDLVREWCATVPEDVPEFTLDDLMKALDEAAVYAGSGAMDDLADDDRRAKRAAKDRERWEKGRRKESARKAGNQIRVPGMVYGGDGKDIPFTERNPTAEERSAAVRLAKTLARVEYPDKRRSHVEAEVPPGRLNMRRVVGNAGAKAAGSRARPAAEWETLKRTEVVAPTLRVGVIVDVSGSMTSAMSPMAATNYVLYSALQRIHARVETAYMGYKAFTPKQKKDAVQVWKSGGGGHNFADATALLDAQLGMTLDEGGARLVVIAGDGNYAPEEWRAAREWIRVLRKQGVTVLWLGYASSDSAESYCSSTGIRFVRMTGRETPAQVAQTVGDAAVQALAEKKL